MQHDSKNAKRRQLLAVLGGGSIVAATAPTSWVKPVISSVVLPAHAQTSLCSPDATVGGPLLGHPSGATTCQAACEYEATSLSAELCSVTETLNPSSEVQCSCELDLP